MARGAGIWTPMTSSSISSADGSRQDIAHLRRLRGSSCGRAKSRFAAEARQPVPGRAVLTARRMPGQTVCQKASPSGAFWGAGEGRGAEKTPPGKPGGAFPEY